MWSVSLGPEIVLLLQKSDGFFVWLIAVWMGWGMDFRTKMWQRYIFNSLCLCVLFFICNTSSPGNVYLIEICICAEAKTTCNIVAKRLRPQIRKSLIQISPLPCALRQASLSQPHPLYAIWG